MRMWIAALLMLFALPAQAEAQATVQSVQMPAWMQRDRVRTPLRVGTELRNGDMLLTGARARVYVHTADGSTLKLGEQARLTLDGLNGQQQDGVFRAALTVAQGAFRFTTEVLSRVLPREVSVRVASATIGIRGTDVWGKDGSDQGLVCLIEGRIAVTGADGQAFSMEQPLSVYRMPRDAAALPLSVVDAVQLQKWAAETEIAQPAAQASGQWKISLLTTADQASALVAYDQWREAGYDVRLLPVKGDAGYAYALRLVQLPSRAAAQQLAEQLTGVMGTTHPAVSR